MNLDSLKIANLEENLSSLDSLMTAQITSQQSKIDSLTMIVHDIEIEKGIFSSMLSIQTGFFSLLIVITVTLIGLISLRFVKRKIKKLKKKNE